MRSTSEAAFSLTHSTTSHPWQPADAPPRLPSCCSSCCHSSRSQRHPTPLRLALLATAAVHQTQKQVTYRPPLHILLHLTPHKHRDIPAAPIPPPTPSRHCSSRSSASPPCSNAPSPACASWRLPSPPPPAPAPPPPPPSPSPRPVRLLPPQLTLALWANTQALTSTL